MLPLPPDMVELGRVALLAQPAVTAIVGQRAYDRIPGAPAWPLLVVGLVDLAPTTEPRQWAAQLQVDCWGRSGSPTDTAEALRLAGTVCAVIPDLRGRWAAGSIVTAALASAVPQPDPTTGRARYAVQIDITATTEDP